MKSLRYIHLTLLVLLLPIFNEGSSQDIDSLLRISEKQNGEDLALTNLQIAQQLIPINLDSAIQFIEQAEEYNADNYRKSIAALILKLQGQVAELNLKYELSMEMRRRAYGLYKEIGNLNEMGWTSRGIGRTFYDLGNYEKATEYFILSLSAFEEDENKRGIADVYNLLGAIQYVAGHYDKALEYYKSSIDLFSEIGEELMLSKVQNNIGILYYEEERYAEAIIYYKEALLGFQLAGNEEAICGTYGNMALCYFEMDMLESALDFIHRSRVLAERNGSIIDEISSYVNTGSFQIKMMQLDSAEYYLVNALSMARTNNLKPLMEEAYFELSNLFSAKKEFETAFAYQVNYVELHDELHEANSEIRIQKLMSSYEQTLKQNKIEQLTADHQSQSLINKVFIALVSVTLVLLIIMVYGYTNNRKKSRLLEEKNSELLSANQKLLDSEEALKKVIDDKDRLFTIIAHDLRNPVAAVSGFSELLYDNYDQLDVVTRKEYVSQIIQGSSRTYELLENLLLWARSQMDSIMIKKTDTNIHKLIDDSIISVQTIIHRKEINLTLSVDCDFSVYADYDMIKAVVRNLITNAVKFSFPGGKVKVECFIEDKMCRIAIIDNGIGMEPEITNGLFTKRIGTTTPGTAGESGSGLGLMICKDYTERNDGEISVSSQAGKGSTFTISFPLKNEAT